MLVAERGQFAEALLIVWVRLLLQSLGQLQFISQTFFIGQKASLVVVAVHLRLISEFFLFVCIFLFLFIIFLKLLQLLVPHDALLISLLELFAHLLIVKVNFHQLFVWLDADLLNIPIVCVYHFIDDFIKILDDFSQLFVIVIYHLSDDFEAARKLYPHIRHFIITQVQHWY